MSLLGKAALAMWWDMAESHRADFEHWHAHEHFPERLGVPGFERASRFMSADGGDGVFVMYELRDHAVLGSPEYLARLNAPTPWSTRLMPQHRNMVRSQCRVLESFGGASARNLLTLRLSPRPAQEEALRAALRQLATQIAVTPGLVGLHVLRHESPSIAPTREQAMRGHGDQVADWVVLATGYDANALRALSEDVLSDAALQALGAADGIQRALYALAYSALPPDVSGVRA